MGGSSRRRCLGANVRQGVSVDACGGAPAGVGVVGVADGVDVAGERGRAGHGHGPSLAMEAVERLAAGWILLKKDFSKAPNKIKVNHK